MKHSLIVQSDNHITNQNASKTVGEDVLSISRGRKLVLFLIRVHHSKAVPSYRTVRDESPACHWYQIISRPEIVRSDSCTLMNHNHIN